MARQGRLEREGLGLNQRWWRRVDGIAAATATVEEMAVGTVLVAIDTLLYLRRGGRRDCRGGGLVDVDLPDLGRVVGAARGELLDVGREKDAGDVLLVGGEVGDGEELGAVEVLNQGPDEDIALQELVLPKGTW